MSKIKDQIALMVEAIDSTLGEGYARKNPELIGRLVQAECMVVSATLIQDALYFLGSEDEEFTMMNVN